MNITNDKLYNMTLQEKLVAEGKTRWLDIGCGKKLTPGFDGVDRWTEDEVQTQPGAKYHRLNIRTASEAEIKALDSFDLIRMQHVFEHFTFEEGEQVLQKCAGLLKKGGLILITVPDLRIYIQRYLNNELKKSDFAEWASARVGTDAPESAYFSYFAHSALDDPHLWCYDYEGLAFQLERTGQFTDIRQLKPDDPLASTPFTHNRPADEVCALAQKL